MGAVAAPAPPPWPPELGVPLGVAVSATAGVALSEGVLVVEMLGEAPSDKAAVGVVAGVGDTLPLPLGVGVGVPLPVGVSNPDGDPDGVPDTELPPEAVPDGVGAALTVAVPVGLPVGLPLGEDVAPEEKVPVAVEAGEGEGEGAKRRDKEPSVAAATSPPLMLSARGERYVALPAVPLPPGE